MLDQTTKHRQKNISTKIPCFFSPGRSLTRPPIPTDPTYLLSVKSANQAIYFWKLNVNQSTTSIPLSTRTAPLRAQGRAVSPSPASCRRCLLPDDAASPRCPPPQLAALDPNARCRSALQEASERRPRRRSMAGPRAAQGLHSGRRRAGAAGALLRLREARVDGPPVLRQVRVVAPPIPLLLSIPLLSCLFWSASIETVTDLNDSKFLLIRRETMYMNPFMD